MSTFNLNVPHPFLVEPILYVGDVPNGVKWAQIQNVLSGCGPVRSGGKSVAPGTNRRIWKVFFPNLISAELVLATMSGIQVQNVKPPWHLLLSHSPTLEEGLLETPVLPLFLRGTDSDQPLGVTHDAQSVFCWFRRAGPLVSIRLNVDVGYKNRACVVQYFHENNAIFARSQGPGIHPFTAWKLKFSLQAYDPQNLHCTNLGSLMTMNELRTQFMKYGQILSAHVVKQGTSGAFGFVSFSTSEEAQTAREQMNGRKLGDSEIVIRYHEPKIKKTIRPHPRARMKPPQSAENEASGAVPVKSTSSPSEARSIADVHLRRMKAEQVEVLAATSASRAAEYEKEKVEKLALAEQTEENAKKHLELARSVLQEAQLALELAQARFTQSSEQIDLAKLEKQTALEELYAATQDKDNALSTAEEARKKKQELLREERELRGLGPDDVLEANDTGDGEEPNDRAELETQEEEAKQREAELEESRRKLEDLRKQEEADRLGREAKAREAKAREAEARAAEAREAELRESLKRMAEFESEEKRRKQEKEEAFKRAREAREIREAAKREKEKRDREEAERRVREAREKVEREKREAQDRVMRYHTAATKEGTRCRLRDEARWKRHIAWTPLKSIERFRIVSDEFDDIKFSTTQPLTFGSIPWPTLHSPYTVKFDNIDWQAVEDFFKKLRLTTDADDYRTSVEKAHRRFHPDKWRSRGLLNTILDDGLRETVEKTGNVVAQALTPIWLESRSK